MLPVLSAHIALPSVAAVSPPATPSVEDVESHDPACRPGIDGDPRPTWNYEQASLWELGIDVEAEVFDHAPSRHTHNAPYLDKPMVRGVASL